MKACGGPVYSVVAATSNAPQRPSQRRTNLMNANFLGVFVILACRLIALVDRSSRAACREPLARPCLLPGKALSPHETLAASTRGRPIARGVHDTAVQTQRVFVTRDSERDWWIASCQAPLPWLHSWRAPSSAMPQEKPIPGHGGRDEAKPIRPPPAIKGVGVSSVLGLRAQLLRCSSLQLCSALFTLSVYPTLVRMPPPCNGAHI